MPKSHINLAFRFLLLKHSNGKVLTARAVYCAQNKYTFISIHTFIKYAKEVSDYEAVHWFSLFR